MKRKQGIRNIKIKGKNVQFKKNRMFQNDKSQAEVVQEILQKDGYLTRIFPGINPAKKNKKIIKKSDKGYYVWYSEKKIRKSANNLAENIIGLNWTIGYNERELKSPSYGKYDPEKRSIGINKQKQELKKLVNQYEEQVGKRKSNKLKKEIIDKYGKDTPISRYK